MGSYCREQGAWHGFPQSPLKPPGAIFKIIQWYYEQGEQVRLTARHFGFSPDTISRWVYAYAAKGMQGLEPGSRRPHKVRQPQTPLTTVQRIQALREQYPRWGREKLRVLLEREGIHISAKSIDWVIARLKARGVATSPSPGL